MFKKRRLKKYVEPVAKITIDNETTLLFSVSDGMSKNELSMYRDLLIKKLGCQCLFINSKIKLEVVID